MNLNTKLSKALKNTLDFKGITLYNPKNLEIKSKLDEENDDLEIGIHCDYMDSYSFLYTLIEMFKNGEVELKFNLDKENTQQNIEYLKDLSIK